MDHEEDRSPVGDRDREMFDEISALMGGISKAFDIDDKAAVDAVEQGKVGMTFEIDGNGNRYILAQYKGKTARLYTGAIKDESNAEH